jgi:RecA-family ATPase
MRISQEDLVNHKKPLDFVIKGIQREEIGVLMGQGSIGKSFLLKSFFTDPENMLNVKDKETGKVKPLNILYLSIEDGVATIANKFADLNLERTQHKITYGFDNEDEWYQSSYGMKHQDDHNIMLEYANLKVNKRVETFEDYLKIKNEGVLGSWVEYDLVIIDTWSRYLAGEFDENSNGDMTKAYNKLIERAKINNCAILIVTHVNKGAITGEMGIAALRGASSLSDNSRLVLSLQKDDKLDNVLKLTTEKINNGRYEVQSFQKDIETGNLTVLQTGNPDYSKYGNQG